GGLLNRIFNEFRSLKKAPSVPSASASPAFAAAGSPDPKSEKPSKCPIFDCSTLQPAGWNLGSGTGLMSIGVDEVKKVALLARLDLGESDLAGMAAQLSAILNYVDQLKQAPAEGVEPLAHPLSIHN